jgi:hypothetical protein
VQILLFGALVFVDRKGGVVAEQSGGSQDCVGKRSDCSNHPKQTWCVIEDCLIDLDCRDIIDRLSRSFPNHLLQASDRHSDGKGQIAQSFIRKDMIRGDSSSDIVRNQHPLAAPLIDRLGSHRQIESLASLLHIDVGLEEIDGPTTIRGIWQHTKISGSDTASWEPNRDQISVGEGGGCGPTFATERTFARDKDMFADIISADLHHHPSNCLLLKIFGNIPLLAAKRIIRLNDLHRERDSFVGVQCGWLLHSDHRWHASINLRNTRQENSIFHECIGSCGHWPPFRIVDEGKINRDEGVVH